MAVQNFQYTKISELPATNTITDDSVVVVNVANATKKMTYANLKSAILADITAAVSALTARVGTLETSVSSLGTRMTTAEGSISTLQGKVSTLETDVSSLKTRMTTAESNISDNTGTINNIITAGFNLIGVDTPTQNNAKKGKVKENEE